MAGVVKNILDWLLNLLSPGLTRRIRNKYLVREVVGAVTAEIEEFGITTAMIAWRIRGYQGAVDDQFAHWLADYVNGYEGIDKDVPGLAALRDPAIAKIDALNVKQRAPNHALTLKTYSLPILDSHLHDLAICPARWRAQVSRFRASLDLLNADANDANEQNARTFVSDLSAAMAVTLRSNAAAVYERVRRRAEELANEAVSIRQTAATHRGAGPNTRLLRSRPERRADR